MRLSLEQSLHQAKAHLRAGRLPEATTIYLEILAKFPKNREADLGLKNLQNKKVVGFSNMQEPPQNQVQSVINLFTQGLFKNALVEVAQIQKIFPNSVLLYNICGAIYTELEQFDLAIENYKKALLIKPDHADAFCNIAIAEQKKGNLDSAIKGYKKAIEINPVHATAYYNMGVTHKAKGDLETAINYYVKAIEIQPSYAEAYFNMGNALEETGEVDKAIECYKQALRIKPDYAKSYFNIGNALRKKGEADKAIDSYKKALEIKPDYAEAYSYIGNELQKKGDLGAAIDSYKKALEIKPEYAAAFYNMGTVLQKKGEADKAIKCYKKALKIKPDYAAAFYNMGLILREKGEADKAIKCYKKALKIKPDYAEAKHLLASMTGVTTDSAPIDYVENLFDDYASKFEHTLVQQLEYQTPRVLAEIVLKNHSGNTLGSVLDLGCGTGLAGVELKKFGCNLEGIDLSSSMLAKAKEKNIYTKLVHGDIVKYLSKAVLDFDYFISTDVFVYVGELSNVFRLIKSRNRRSGKLVFSTEHTERDGFFLEKSGRYSHSKQYIEGLCDEFDYQLTYFSKANLRKENNIFLTGGLYSLDF